MGTKFPVDVNIDGYQIYSQPTKSTHDGVVMHVSKNLDHVVREDISVLEEELEIVWIEIITGAKAKNILCGCFYRHPNTDTKNFIEHMDDHYIFIISRLWLTSHHRSTMVLLDTGTPGTSREIYSEGADGEIRTRNPSVI